MKSLDTLLAEAIGKMKPETLKKYNDRTNGKQLAQENLVNVAESLLAQDGGLSERQPIKRNNGAQGEWSQESNDPYAAGDAILMEGLRSRGLLPEQTVECKEAAALSGPQRKEYEFCRLIGLSESDALMSASKSL